MTQRIAKGMKRELIRKKRSTILTQKVYTRDVNGSNIVNIYDTARREGRNDENVQNTIERIWKMLKREKQTNCHRHTRHADGHSFEEIGSEQYLKDHVCLPESGSHLLDLEHQWF